MCVNGVLELNIDLPDVEYAEVELPNGEKMYLLWELDRAELPNGEVMYINREEEDDGLPAPPPAPRLRPERKRSRRDLLLSL